MSSLPSQKLAVFGGPPAAPVRQRGSGRDSAAGDAAVRQTRAFAYLVEALNTARDLGLDVWDFALDLPGLRAAGVTDSELRWAVVMGYVEHRTEVTAVGAQRRAFLAVSNLQLTERSCFVLTTAGEDYAGTAPLVMHARLSMPSRALADGRAPSVRIVRMPEWDVARRQLRIGDEIIKEFKVPAGNQELILAAFHELGWPEAIDDPLPPREGLDRKRRLHDSINSLNRNQRRRLLKFRGKGDGQGVCWEFHQSSTRLPPNSV